MNFRRRVILLSTLLVFFLHGLSATPPISLRITGRWQDRLDSANLTGGAGTDFANPFESAAGQVDLTITKTLGPTAPWRMDVRRADITWNPSFRIYAKVTSIGTGDGSVTGGGTYFEITNADQEFFTGTGDRTKIEIQYKIEGFSVANAVIAVYDTDIYYTVVELP